MRQSRIFSLITNSNNIRTLNGENELLYSSHCGGIYNGLQELTWQEYIMISLKYIPTHSIPNILANIYPEYILQNILLITFLIIYHDST